jgi:glycoprotein 2-beta-D-xylosyltransferase
MMKKARQPSFLVAGSLSRGSNRSRHHDGRRRRRRRIATNRVIILCFGMTVAVAIWFVCRMYQKILTNTAGLTLDQVRDMTKNMQLLYNNHTTDANNNVDKVNNNDYDYDFAFSYPKYECDKFDHSIKRPTHGCQVNNDTRTVFCNFENLRIDTDLMKMVALGGEVLSTVMGRTEETEFPTYQRGTFSTSTKPNFDVPTEFRSDLHYVENVLNSLRYPSPKNKYKIDLTCKKTYPGTTLFVTRYEYVNLYHTITDWWNAFSVLPRTNYNFLLNEGISKPDRVVFLDGHAQGLLDSTWETLFGEYHYIKHIGVRDGGICFERAIFIPPGYKSPLFNAEKNDHTRQRCPNREMAASFSNFVLEQYDLLRQTEVIRGNIVLIDRQPFVSHPRSDPKNLDRQVTKSELNDLKKKLNSIPDVTVNLVRLETMTFAEQLKLIRQTHVLIGMHGAALSHLMFMDEKSHIIEFQEGYQDFFEYMSKWKGIDYELVGLEWSEDEYSTLSFNAIQEITQLVKKYMSR